MPKVNHNRIRQKYSAKPTEREKQFHRWCIDNFPCACGCGCPSEIAHHVLSSMPEKRWRRDHEVVVPLTAEHHFDLHLGNARKIEAEWGVPERALELRKQAYECYVL